MKDIVVSAPGKVILHGEHSVVYGKSAIASCLNIRTYLHLRQTTDNRVSLVLPDIGVEHSWCVEDIQRIPIDLDDYSVNPTQPTTEQLKHINDFLKPQNDTASVKDMAAVGFLYFYLNLCKHSSLPSIEIRVKSELPVGAGLGSSAGFSVCLSTALLLLKGRIAVPKGDNIWKEEDLDTINKWAYIGETLIHGKPSGIDNSIATYGKAIKFKSGTIHHLDKMPKLKILLINTKVPRSTKDLVAGVKQKYEQYEDIIQPVLESMEAIVQKSEDVLSNISENGCNMAAHYKTLQDLIDMNQNLLRFLGVSHPSLETVCSICNQHRLHCKLTGAGGGGCAFCLIPPDTTEDVMNSLKKDLRSHHFECWETTIGGNGVQCNFINNTEDLHHIFRQRKRKACSQ